MSKTEELIYPTVATYDRITRWIKCVGAQHQTGISAESEDEGKGILVCVDCHQATMPPSDMARQMMKHIELRVIAGSMSADHAPQLIQAGSQ